MAANSFKSQGALLVAILLASVFSASTDLVEPPPPPMATKPPEVETAPENAAPRDEVVPAEKTESALPRKSPAPPRPAKQDPIFLMHAPVDCEAVGGCFIQNYVDVDPGPEFRDYTCGHLGYNGHKGIDFALRDLEAMRRGAPVLAPATGTVLRTRSNMPDGTFSRSDPGGTKGRECGNGMVIRHRDGWETQLCHLRQGSLGVRPGDRVAAGQPIGLIGQSGRAEFPHLHITVRRKGEVIDPFTGLSRSKLCGTEGASLWRPEALAAFAYRGTEIIRQGFAAKRPSRTGIIEGRYRAKEFPRHTSALYYWAAVKGLKAGDVITLKIINTAERIMAKRRYKPFDRDKARVFVRIGGKLRSGQLRPGTYRAELEVIRGDSVAFRSGARMTVN
jgi:hypothetical protein